MHQSSLIIQKIHEDIHRVTSRFDNSDLLFIEVADFINKTIELLYRKKEKIRNASVHTIHCEPDDIMIVVRIETVSRCDRSSCDRSHCDRSHCDRSHCVVLYESQYNLYTGKYRTIGIPIQYYDPYNFM